MSREDARSYLALGDSYSIGEGVEGGERWTSQLVMRLRALDVSVAFPRTVATTGWTCEELEQAMDSARPPLEPGYDMVSLLIGVNDQYRQYDPAAYPGRFARLLERAIALADGHADRVLVLSIPDWGVTPFAAALEPRRDPAQIATELDQYNATAAGLAAEHGAHFVDCSDLSRAMCADPANLAADALHPGAPVYTAWADRALPAALKIVCANPAAP